MPVKIKKLKGGQFEVRTPNGVKSKHTTKKNAMRQQRLLNALEHNPEFKKKVRRTVIGK